MIFLPSKDVSLSVPKNPWRVHTDDSQVFENGVYQIYSTTTHEWIKPLMIEKSKESPALFIVCATIQICLDDDGLSLRFHRQFERALRTFQAELSACNGVIRSSTFGAGLLLCTISVGNLFPKWHFG